MNTYDLIFLNIEVYSPAIPLLAFFVRRQKRFRWTTLLLIYLVVYFTSVLFANLKFLYSVQSFSGDNGIIYIILSIFTFCLFSFLIEQFLSSAAFKAINRAIIIIIVLFFIVNAVWVEGTMMFNSYSAAVSSFILVSYCVYYYKLQLERLQSIFVEKQSSFWIVSGIFLYSAGNFFLFTMYNYLTRTNNDFAISSWYLNDILILIMNIFFAKGIQCNWEK